ncbi:MAG: tRNA pseudouridine(38-40) synthase TruA [Bacteroidota bacterium]
MEQRYLFEMAYDGTNYAGWQVQPGVDTIQGELTQQLTRLLGNRPVQVVGCGRTDAGVHASQYFFHVDLPERMAADQLVYKLNKMLPPALVIYDARVVQPDFHARFDATARTYRYFIQHQKYPFNRYYSWYFPQDLDVAAMNRAAECLIGKKDFTSFSKLHTDVQTNICTVHHAVWTTNEHQIQFEIKANRFLRNMVRAIVGTLIDAGRGKLSPSEFQSIIEKKDRGSAGVSVPGHGLFLHKIDYPEDN